MPGGSPTLRICEIGERVGLASTELALYVTSLDFVWKRGEHVAAGGGPREDVVTISDEIVVDMDEGERPVGIDISTGAAEIADLGDLTVKRNEAGERAALRFPQSFMVESFEVTKEKSLGKEGD